MLNRIKLTNFRKHRDTELRLQGGLMVMRGNNEAGKSTLIEGICYALFGVKALRSSIDEAVTHGEPVSTLKAELDLVVDGVAYNVRRGKSGAEVTYEGGRVTGQTEVTSFLCGKMRVDPASAAKLMLANQNEIRGALEAGPKATAELIERLAEFDQIDLLVERMQERLSLGSTTAIEQRLEDAVQRREAAGEPQEPDYAAMEADVARLKAEHAAAVLGVSALDGDLSAAQAALDTARAAEEGYKQACRALGAAQARFVSASQALTAAEQAANRDYVFPMTEDEVRAEIAQLEQAQEAERVWGIVRHSLDKPAVQYEATIQDLRDEVKAVDRRAAEAAAVASDARVRAAQARAQLSHGTCSFCGQDFSDLPQVASKNAELQHLIDLADAEAEEAGRVHRAALAESVELTGHLQEAQSRESLWKAHPAYVKVVDASVVPAELAWAGPNIQTDVKDRLAQLRRLIKEMADAAAEGVRALARLEAAQDAKKAAEVELSAAKQAAEAAEIRPDIGAAEAQRDAVLARRRPLEQKVSDLMVAVRDAEYTLKDSRRAHDTLVKERQALETAIEDLRQQVKVTEFNNQLLKRVRQCRPLIADKLWNIVLSAVSSYFSEMRGQKSVVTKEADGFKVDDHGVASLSGSTLDILGLAIRVALVKTFLPQAPFIVLDEPCAAMDQTRTEATLGFVVGAGFKQVLVVTHEDTSETVADALIEI